ncbi:MAG: ABC transporter ATP-binding protein [Clostridiaceae bacterium]|nr:ABC transporter ATP-binding protein [Clostridiaceae bacterium]
MIKLLKYLKPFTLLLFAAIALLFVQAMADLSLPDYMSDIVNVGIQQGGVENAVPQVVRQSRMEQLSLFMRDNERNQVMKYYDLVDKSSKEYERYVKIYPGLANEPVYILKGISGQEIESLNPIFGNALLSVAGLEKMKMEAKDGQIDFNGHKIPADSDLFALLEKQPAEQRIQMSSEMTRIFTALGEDMVVQAATGAVRAEYEALGMDTGKIQISYIVKTGLIMLIISIISAICVILVGFFASRTAAGLSRNLRQRVFTKVESFSGNEMDKFSTASLITRTTNDINQIQMATGMIIRTVFYAPIMGIGGIIRALAKSPSMSWIIVVAVAAVLGLIIGVFLIAMPKFKVIQKLLDRLNLVARENLSGMMVIRAFNTQNFEEERFNKANKDLTAANLFVNRVMVVMFPTIMLVMNGVTLLIVWVGAHRIADSGMQVGDMMAFMQYAIQIMFSFLMMSFMFIMIPRASIAGQRIVDVLDTEPEIRDPQKPKDFNNAIKGVVEFSNVSFRYNGADEDMLKDISFKALPGSTTAIIGSTGSGKTTLVNLIPRFYDVTKGQVLVGGVDVRDLRQYDLREKIGYVPQKSTLFEGTIESNLKYADKNASVEELEKAAETAQAMEFIKDKPEGFMEKISQGGSNVSGGQKQRLSIARAIIKKPEILIFDDSFSALDFKTDAALRKALKGQIQSSTVIIVAQRISTIMNADKIIVLDEGRIVGTGTHRELMESCETYQEIALSQLSKEELA